MLVGKGDLKIRTRKYALAVIHFFPNCPKEQRLRYWDGSCSDLGRRSEHISKIEGALQELEESEYWLELLGESGLASDERLADVKKETGELKGIFVSIVRKTKARTKFPGP
jgi:hypothetical protein